jgi:hypothetical protein
LGEFADQVRALINAGDVRISEHGYDELANDALTAREVLNGIQDAIVLRNTHTIQKVTVPYFCRRIKWIPPFMLYGESQKVMTSQLF